ncbi:dynamin family protein [Actinomadura mexicana]|uniref:Dynamin family protein n=1 Tax=Actinomadura mexicana TaxID=134959 RepID=A0A239AZW7_9ACTN|nr:dynamin family protein [Actinomadura mexicana]SNS00862.1 Dynamin family protein [Actinomadura mexicana]
MTDPHAMTAPDAAIDRIVTEIVEIAREQLVSDRLWRPLEALAGRWHEPFARVTVVGEVSVGKSTLINALVGQEILPAATEALSSVPVELRHGDRTSATVAVQRGDAITYRELNGTAEIGEYLTTRGEKGVEVRHGRDAFVRNAGITLPSPLLAEGLRLADTPGVGGLNPAHRRLTLATLTDCDAVLFVIKPGEPVSEPELRFLAESVERVGTYMIVQTHRDQTGSARRLRHNLDMLGQTATWSRICDGDEKEAERLAGKFADVRGEAVSARLALNALVQPPGPERDAELRVSGIPGLAERLRQEVISRVGDIHRRDLLRLAESTAAATRARLTERRTLLGQDDAASDAIRAREQNIHRWAADRGDTWKPDLEAATLYAQSEVRRLAAERVRILRTTYLDRFPGMGVKKLAAAVPQMMDEADATVIEMRQIVADRLNDAVDTIRHRGPGDAVSAHLDRLSLMDGLAGNLPTSFETADLTPDTSFLTGVASMGIGAITHRPDRRPDHEKDRALPVPAHRPPPGHGTGHQGGGLGYYLVTAVVLAGLNAWRRRKARTQEAAVRVYEEVVRAVAGPAVEDSVRAAERERDAIIEVIEDRVEEERQQVVRDREDLAQMTGLTTDRRVELLNGIDLSARRLDALLAELRKVGA